MTKILAQVILASVIFMAKILAQEILFDKNFGSRNFFDKKYGLKNFFNEIGSKELEKKNFRRGCRVGKNFYDKNFRAFYWNFFLCENSHKNC